MVTSSPLAKNTNETNTETTLQPFILSRSRSERDSNGTMTNDLQRAYIKLNQIGIEGQGKYTAINREEIASPVRKHCRQRVMNVFASACETRRLLLKAF